MTASERAPLLNYSVGRYLEFAAPESCSCDIQESRTGERRIRPWKLTGGSRSMYEIHENRVDIQQSTKRHTIGKSGIKGDHKKSRYSRSPPYYRMRYNFTR